MNVIVKKVVVLTDRLNKGQRLLKIDCPFCGCEHTHGGGKESDGDIQQFGGGRVSHCWKVPCQSYTLIVPEGVPYESC